jgi:hypothetical protein
VLLDAILCSSFIPLQRRLGTLPNTIESWSGPGTIVRDAQKPEVTMDLRQQYLLYGRQRVHGDVEITRALKTIIVRTCRHTFFHLIIVRAERKRFHLIELLAHFG